jgi:hypothetical protein
MSRYIVYKQGEFSNKPRFESNNESEIPSSPPKPHYTGHVTFTKGKFIEHHSAKNHKNGVVQCN